MTLHPRRRAWFGQWPTILWLTVAWTMLWGDLTWANILGGLALGVVVTLVFPLPAIGFHVRVRPVSLLWLVAHFLWDLVRASFQVAFQALHVTRVPRGAVIGVRLRNPADLYLTVTAELSTLVPGSLVVEAHRLTGMLYLHVLDLEAYGGEEKVRADVLALEERVLYALASDEELENAGLPVGPWWGPAARAQATATRPPVVRPVKGETP